MELARAIGGFSIGVAAHPAGHPRSPDTESDRDHLAAKLALADFAVTQFFFEASEYLGLVADLAARGVDKPVLPGIMPVTSLSHHGPAGRHGGGRPGVDAGPPPGGRRARRAATPSARRVCELATELCADLLDDGVPGLHFYTLQPLERDPGDLRRARPGPPIVDAAG